MKTYISLCSKQGLTIALMSYQQAPAYPKISWWGPGSPSLIGFPSIISCEIDASRSSSLLDAPLDLDCPFFPIIGYLLLTLGSKCEHTDCHAGTPTSLEHVTFDIKRICDFSHITCGPRDFDRTGGAVALTRWIENMESMIDNNRCLANQRVKYAASSFIGKALTWWNTQVQARGRDAANEMVWNDFKELLTTEFCPINEIKKLEGEFWNHSMVGDDHAGYTDRYHELAKLVTHLVTPEVKPAILTAGILTDEAVLSGTLAKAGEKRKERDEASKLESVGKDERKLKGDEASVGRENRNNRGNENQSRGRAFNVNVIDALQDPNVVTSTYSLNNLYATVLFDSGADFSFISTKFAPLLNEKPSIANPGYVIEVANGKKEEVDRIFCDCRLELGDLIFPIGLIPLGQGSFDVIVGMDWLSNQKVVIVCHEKIVRIPVEEGKVLCVQGERNVRKTKTLMSTKANKPTLSDIPVVRDFEDIFSDDLSGLPPQ
ncbi:putative reverse transcriptase domain-containing protein [Tanacetum coccineum]